MSSDIENMEERRVMQVVGKIRSIFDANFNHTWFFIIVDEIPMDNITLRIVREFLASTPFELLDMYKVKQGAEALEKFISDLENHLVPNIKEILMVSNLRPGRKIEDPDRYLRMRLLCEVIPHNVAALSRLSDELNTVLYGYTYLDETIMVL